jgi:hypothetical protein
MTVMASWPATVRSGRSSVGRQRPPGWPAHPWRVMPVIVWRRMLGVHGEPGAVATCPHGSLRGAKEKK